MLYPYYGRKYCNQTFLGVGHITRSIYKGIRSTSADFVYSCKIENLTVKLDVFIDRIIVEKNSRPNTENREYKAIGVEAYDDVNDQPIITKARKQIILSAGQVIFFDILLGPYSTWNIDVLYKRFFL